MTCDLVWFSSLFICIIAVLFRWIFGFNWARVWQVFSQPVPMLPEHCPLELTAWRSPWGRRSLARYCSPCWPRGGPAIAVVLAFEFPAAPSGRCPLARLRSPPPTACFLVSKPPTLAASVGTPVISVNFRSPAAFLPPASQASPTYQSELQLFAMTSFSLLPSPFSIPPAASFLTGYGFVLSFIAI